MLADAGEDVVDSFIHYVMITHFSLLYLALYHEIVVSPHVEKKLLK